MNVEEMFQQAVLRQQRGDLAGAASAYQAVIDAEPNHASAMANLASLLKRSGRAAEAVACLKRAAALQPQSPEILFNLGNALEAAQQREQAVAAYVQALSCLPAFFPAHVNLANLLRDLGRSAEAETHYRSALQLKPDAALVHMNLGNLLRLRGRAEEAVRCHQEVIRLSPQNADGYFNLGNALTDAGRVEEAIAAYRHALAKRADFADARLNLAKMYVMDGQEKQAEAAYRELLAFEPGHAGATLAWARLLHKRESTDEALAMLDAAADVNPRDTELLRALAELHCAVQRFADAERRFRQTLAVDPQDAEAHNGLGLAILGDSGSVSAAIASFQQALHHDPRNAGAHNNLGQVYRSLKRMNEAVHHLRLAVQLDPDLETAHANLASVLIETGHVGEGLEVARAIVQHRPESAAARVALGCGLVQQARIADALVAFDEAERLDPEHDATVSNALFATLYSDRHDAEAVTAAHRQRVVRRWGEIVPRTEYTNDPDPERRCLRVGYVSPDMREHPVAFFLESVLAHHDPQRVTSICYAVVTAADATTERLRNHTGLWRSCDRWTDDRLDEQIRADGVDILVDLAGHTAGNRVALICRKPAPVQALFVGYPCTSGLPAMDTIVVDEYICPKGYEHLYTERPVRLPGCVFCYRPPDDAPPVTPPPAEANGFVTFGSYNNLPKISPRTLDLWSEVLRAVPGSRLLIKSLPFRDPGTRELFVAHFAERGIERDRLDLLEPTTPLAKFLEEYGRIDIGLDPVPYNGGTTTVQALWMGVPVITLAGDHFFGRMGVSVLSNVGLEELIAQTAGDYVRIARELAADGERLAELRRGLRQRVADSPVCDAESYTRGLEQAYREMWRAWCEHP